MCAADQARCPESAAGVLFAEGVQVVADRHEFGFAPAGQIIGDPLPGAVDHAAEAVPAAAREHVAKIQLGGDAGQLARKAG